MNATSRLLLVLVSLLGCMNSSSAQRNRNSAQRDRNAALESTASHYKAAEFQDADGNTLKYRILEPASVSSDQKVPLVLFLHGAGERGDDNIRQLIHGAADFADSDRRKAFPAYVVFPQCPSESQWVELPWSEATGKGTFKNKPSEPMRLTLELVGSLVKEHNIDTNRIYVTGLSMGGYGTWFAAAFKNDLFAAAAPVCGGGDPEWANKYSGIPIWAFHGGKDSVVPPSRSREMIVALIEAGHHPEIRYTEYPNANHNSWSATYSRDDFYTWLFRQRRK